jgi:hypothetical protein
MKKVDQEAIARGERIKTIVTRIEEHPLTGERKTVFLYAMMWMDPQTKTAFIEPIDDHPLFEDEVIAFNKENGVSGLGEYIEQPRETWTEKVDDLSSERVGFDIGEEWKALVQDPKGKTFNVQLKGKKADDLLQWLKTKNVFFSFSDSEDVLTGMSFIIPSKLYKETLEFLKEDDQNIVLIRRA